MHLALLRGINVGGKNIIRQEDLRAAFEELGLEEVRTYIQSGNVLFRAPQGRAKGLLGELEAHLSDRFDYTARVVLKSAAQYRKAVACAHASWGHDPDRKHNAMFLEAGLQAPKVLASLPAMREDLEEVSTGPGVLFWSASIKKLGSTTAMKIGQRAVYRQMTVRNHKTTWKLLELLEG